MLKFLVHDKGKPAINHVVRNAYLVGSDGTAMRADIRFEQGMVVCNKRDAGAAALALQQQVGDCGELTLQTCLLPEREEPYLLNLELVRHRLMVLFNKLEDWMMLDLDPEHPVAKRTEFARKLFIEALCLQTSDPARADRMAHEALVMAIDGTEELALAHAELLLNRRKATGSLPRAPIGCGVALDQNNDRVRGGLAANFDFVRLPTPWRALAPEEGDYRWGVLDSWVEWATKSRFPITAGPIVSFDTAVLPDWIYIWEHDYDTVRDLMYEHCEAIVNRYKGSIQTWVVASGLHVNAHFGFAFEQLLDLTRMATMVVRKAQPNARIIVEITQPFGEYYGQNQRSIPPMMYADLLIQGAINFDAFGLRLLLGQAAPGQYARDLMQVSNLLDQFSVWQRPVAVTVAAPSNPVTELMIASPDPGKPVDANCGHWRKPWSPVVQSHWLEAMLYITLSKPFVESVTWGELVDHENSELPLAGLVSEEHQPKQALRRAAAFRKSLQVAGSKVSPAVGVTDTEA
ncbi:MAG: hypothetical protein GC164_11870 [Phycisphaera sp.]|nr:hypothetical protein [Phycisphaera sp.]